MLPSWLRAILAYCAAVAAADFAAVAVGLALYGPLTAPANFDLYVYKTIAGIGALIALPIIVIMGLIMIFVSRRLGPADRVVYWALAGCIGAIPGVMLADGRRHPSPWIVLWLISAAIAGALVFRLVWRGGRTGRAVRSG